MNKDGVGDLLDAGADPNSVNEYGMSALYLAAQNRNAEAVADLISAGADINQPGFRGKLPIHIAAENGSLRVLVMLLDAGANPNSVDDKGESPLWYAAREGNADTVAELTYAGADINHPGVRGNLPIHVAAESGSLATLKLFVEAGADLEARGIGGETPLWDAIFAGDFEATQYLLEQGANPDPISDFYTTPLFEMGARLSGGLRAKFAILLLDAGADVNFGIGQVDTPLHRAAIGGDMQNINVLLDYGGEINAQNTHSLTPLFFAGHSNQKEAAKLLLNRGAIPADLYSAISGGDTTWIDRLMEDGHDVNGWDWQGSTPLSWAIRLDDALAVDSLLGYGADPFGRGPNGRSPLTTAVISGDNQLLQKLLGTGVDLRLEPVSAAALLINAAEYKNLAGAITLIAHGVPVDVVDGKGRSPLHWACKNNQLEFVQLLLILGSPPTEPDGFGNTPLHYAASSSITDLPGKPTSMAIGRLLLEAGAEPNALNNDGLTPIDVGSQSGYNGRGNNLGLLELIHGYGGRHGPTWEAQGS